MRRPTNWDVTTIRELTAEFVAGTLEKPRWDHTAHLIVATNLVHRHGRHRALEVMRSGVLKLNDAHGTANSNSSGYHETITRFFIDAIDEVIGPLNDLTDAASAVLGSHLSDPAVVFRFWSKPMLFSPDARTRWIEPDL